MAPKKRKNPFDEEIAVDTKAEDGQIFHDAFNACVVATSARAVEPENIITNISKEDLQKILSDLETGKAQNDVRCRNIAKFMTGYKQMCEAESRIQSSKSKLEHLVGASFWKLGEEGNSNFQMGEVKAFLKMAIKSRPD
eukprot:TRINITY_DN12579_c0_g1_i1.p1 TRINITY_DN12579_c0_g1~~TRINITY_DN12579_c0_g1_i1.p1  ORF type:complete len:139 (-),score=20.22 TRINITY_DN12579_c0_g1_i1:11-427(-)